MLPKNSFQLNAFYKITFGASKICARSESRV